MKYKTLLLLTISLFLISSFLAAGSVFAFGISPPWVYQDKLVPGSHFEQDIYLTQADPTSPLKIEVRIDESEIKSWFRFEPGEDFTIPAGQQQFPLRVIVDVPQNAGYDTYTSKIRIRAISEGGGQVAILVGGVADVRLIISGEEFSDFQISDFKVKDIEEGWPVKVYIKMQNLGNVRTRPSKVHIDIYDQYHKELLQSGDATDMTWIESFQKGESVAQLATKLGIGEYWAEIEIFKKGESTLKDKTYFRVLERGSIKPYITILGISIYIWIAIIAGIGVIVVAAKKGFFGKILEKMGISINIQKVRK